jgi:hypothetical protein
MRHHRSSAMPALHSHSATDRFLSPTALPPPPLPATTTTSAQQAWYGRILARRHRGPRQSSSMCALTVAPPLWCILPPPFLHRDSLGFRGAVALLTRAHRGRRRPARHRAAPPPAMHAGDGAPVHHRSNKGNHWVRVVAGSATVVTSPPVASPSTCSGRSIAAPCFSLSVTWDR